MKGAICSSIAGFSSFCVHAGGTPTSLYLLPLRLKKEIYVGTRIIFFSCVNLIKLPLYIYLSMMNFDTLFQSVSLFPLALIGIIIGYQLLKIIEENLFYNHLITSKSGKTLKETEYFCKNGIYKLGQLLEEKSKEARNIPFDKKLTSLANNIVLDTDVEKDDIVVLGNEKKVKMYKIDGYLEEFALTKKEAEDLIMNARKIVFN